MPLGRLLGFTKDVQDLADKPSGTMTSAQLKAWFDAAPEELRVFVNNQFDKIELDYALQADLESLVIGQIPAGSITATNITVSDTNSHFTGANVETVLDELFTFANDGKTTVATAVTAKGVTASPTDTFSTLATKIGQISTGKKWASGTATSSAGTATFTYAATTGTGVFYKITVTGLTFKPSVIYIEGASYNLTYSEINADLRYPKTIKMHTTVNDLGTYANWNFKGDVSTASVTSTGFVMPYNASSVAVKWIAYE